MENRYDHDTPLFEVLLELQPPKIVFLPAVEMSDRGLLGEINSMMGNILNVTDMIPLVAQPTDKVDNILETFAFFLEPEGSNRTSKDATEIEEMQYDITRLARETARKTITFAAGFEKYNFIWRTNKKIHMENFLKFGRIVTNEEVEKIEEGTLTLNEQRPHLGDFKKVIDYYGDLFEEIKAYETIHVFNQWLRVNMKGLKYRMMNEVSKWSYSFKEFLKDKVVNDLNELDQFIALSTESLNLVATNEDAVTLLKILKTIGMINDRDEATEKMFDPLKEIVDLLRSYDLTFDETVNNQFAELPEKWITLKKLSVVVKQTVGPVQAYQVDLIKKRINMFDIRTKLYHENFMRSPFFSVPCPNVYELCDLVHMDLSDMEKQIIGLSESALHFQLSPPEDGKMVLCRRLIRMVKQIWDFLHAVSSCIEDWKKTPWKKINVEDMETECKRFSKDMRNFDKEMKLFKPYLETEAMIKNLLTSLRAITELQNPAIRDRHWNELMQATKVRTLTVSRHHHASLSKSPSIKNSQLCPSFNWFSSPLRSFFFSSL